MDTELVIIVVASSVVFIAVIIWKLRWLYKKMLAAEQEQSKKVSQ